MLKKNLKPDWDYLYDRDVEQLGNIFEYAYKQGYCMSELVPKFMNSSLRRAMDDWHPQLTNGPIQVVLRKFIEDFGPISKSDEYYPLNCMKWVGMAYAYLSYYLNMSSVEIYKLVPFEKMVDNYTTGHERSFTSFAEKFIADYNRCVADNS